MDSAGGVWGERFRGEPLDISVVFGLKSVYARFGGKDGGCVRAKEEGDSFSAWWSVAPF